jgi:hypothetical protein
MTDAAAGVHAGLGGAAMAWPPATGAQQVDRMRRIGVLMAFDENDLEGKADLSELTQGLRSWVGSIGATSG